MKIFSVIGISKSGKTTTVENVIKELKRRNYSVGSVKEIQCKNFTIDQEGTDTCRHRKAGSDLITARADCETDIIYPGNLEIIEILKLYHQDYIVMEGVADYDCPVILCANAIGDIEGSRNKEFFKRVFLISGVISNEINEYNGIPVINSENNIKKLADLIEQRV